MKGVNIFHGVVQGCAVLVFFTGIIALSGPVTGCTSEVPYFEMSALGSYTAPDIIIPYSYSAESDVHEAACLLEVQRTTGGGTLYYDAIDDFSRTLPREGVLRLVIPDPGNYRLTVTLLSSRGTIRKELKFATDTVEFGVVP